MATTTAVNILVTDASPNRVAGEFGIRAARSANPHEASNSVSPPRVTRAQPDRSSSRSQAARVAAASAKRSSLIGYDILSTRGSSVISVRSEFAM